MGILRTTLAAFAALLLAAPVAQAAYTFDVPGGYVEVKRFPSQPKRVQEAVEDTVLMESGDPTVLPLDPELCPTGRVIVTAEKVATIRQQYVDVNAEPRNAAGIFLRSKRPGQHCRVFFNARVLKHYDEAQLCHLTLHELGHARGLDHTKTGLMAPVMPILPDDGPYCEWAWSEWRDGMDF